jgi:hypothetical protein
MISKEEAEAPKVDPKDEEIAQLKQQLQKVTSNLEYLASAFQTVGGAVDMARKVRF